MCPGLHPVFTTRAQGKIRWHGKCFYALTSSSLATLGPGLLPGSRTPREGLLPPQVDLASTPLPLNPALCYLYLHCPCAQRSTAWFLLLSPAGCPARLVYCLPCASAPAMPPCLECQPALSLCQLRHPLRSWNVSCLHPWRLTPSESSHGRRGHQGRSSCQAPSLWAVSSLKANILLQIQSPVRTDQSKEMRHV